MNGERKRKTSARGIHIQIADNLVICDIDFVIRYGVKIPEFSKQINRRLRTPLRI